MPTLELINSSTYKILVGRDEIELGDINAVQCLAHLKYRRHRGTSFTISMPNTPTGLVAVDVQNGKIRVPYGDNVVELTAHDPDENNPEGRAEFNVIINTKPLPDANGEYWQTLNFETSGLTLERVFGLDEEYDQARCKEKFPSEDYGEGDFIITPTSITAPNGQVVKKRDEHLVHSIRGTAIQCNRDRSVVGKNKNNDKDIAYVRVSRDHLTLPRRLLQDANGKTARIEDIELNGSQLRFKLPAQFIKSARYPVQHITGTDPSYTEEMESFLTTELSGDSTWTTIDLTSYGAPDSGVAEIICANQEAGVENYFGVRAVGSSIARYLSLHEAEGGGETHCRLFVQLDSSAQAQFYHSDISDEDSFYIVGYWENVTFTEDWTNAAVQDSRVWVDIDTLNPSVNPPANRVCHIIYVNYWEAASYGGVRTGGSSLDRKILLHETESGGQSVIDFIVKSDSNGDVEVYDYEAYTSWYKYAGYFGSEMDFVELWQEVFGSGSAWVTKDLTSYLDEDGRTIDFMLLNYNDGGTAILGVRDGDDTTTNRYIEEHEAESADHSTPEFSGFSMSANTNSSGEIQVYGLAVSYPHALVPTIAYLTGYFKPAISAILLSVTDGLKAGDSRSAGMIASPSVIDGFKGGDTNSEAGIMSAVLTDGFKLSDLTLLQFVYLLSLSDGLKAGDSTLEDMVASLEATDTLKSGDIPLADMIASLQALDGAKLSDAIIPLVSMDMIIADGIKLSDSPLAELGAVIYYLSVIDGLKAGDSSQSIMEASLSLSEGIKLSDSSSLYFLVALAVSEGFTTGETPLASMLADLQQNEGVKLSDVTLTGMIASLVMADSIKGGDSASLSAIMNVLLSDSIKLSDSSLIDILAGVIYLSVTDGLKAGDSPLAAMLANVILSDGTKLSDSPLLHAIADLSVADGIKAGDLTLSALTAYLALSDGIKTGDVPLEALLADLQIADGIKLGETTLAELASAIVYLTLTDSFKIGDAPVANSLIQLLRTDGINLSDLSSLSMQALLQVVDTFKLSDLPIMQILRILRILSTLSTLLNITASRQSGLVIISSVNTLFNITSIIAAEYVIASDISTELTISSVLEAH